ncbi:MAG: DegT/DnrJ/EryC1/StrS family aminotransferase [Nitrososphaeria archaeon]|nr:DegT/DnrJ/EryC1/StrS family aminotransferase [Aigarchaeota archaeon]MCX8187203.1 DegT/DnrJ/EryC1/StrS family aminotransferase [Nitrososphaeria archaeon]
MAEDLPAILGGEPVRKTPYPSWPIYDQREEDLILEALRSGRWSVGGRFQDEFERRFAEFQEAKHALLCASGTAALKIALKAMGLRPGDRVIVPAYTFIATATSAIDLGLEIAYADIDPGSYTIDPENVRKLADGKTRAVIPVHIAGRPADMDALVEIAEERDLMILEDAAQAHGAEWRGRRVGAIGDAGAFSFYQSKNITCGEGGAITTNSDELAEAVWSLRNVGRPRTGPWYEHGVYGWNYRMTEFQAAVLIAQLERAPKLMELRDRGAWKLDKLLSEIDGVEPLKPDKRVTRHAYHLYIFKYDPSGFSNLSKDRFVEALRAEGIPCNAGYRPLYSYSFLPPSKPLPNTEKASKIEAVWIPQNVLLAEEKDLEDIQRAIEKIKKNAHKIPK